LAACQAWKAALGASADGENTSYALHVRQPILAESSESFDVSDDVLGKILLGKINLVMGYCISGAAECHWRADGQY
jgi:hypothetical protein